MLISLCWNVDLSPFVTEVRDGTEQPAKYHIFNPQLALYLWPSTWLNLE